MMHKDDVSKIKIAFLSFDWNFEIINEYYEGIKRYVEEHADVSVCVFHGFGKYDGIEPEDGTFAIYELPDFKDFDGVIIQGNRVWPKQMRQEIATQAIKDGAVVASINYPLEGAMYIGTDNYHSMKEMTLHFIKYHGASKLAFICGLDTSAEAKDRLDAFVDACQENNITEYRVFHGGWSRKAGEEAAIHLLQEYGKENLPQVIMCASDTLANGVLNIFEKEDIQVPDDVLMSGFDNSIEAIMSDVRLTTVNRDYRSTSYFCMDNLYMKIKGYPIENAMYSTYKMIYSESCGCMQDALSVKDTKRNYLRIDRALKNFYRQEDVLEPAMLNANTFSDLMDVIEKEYAIFGVKHIFHVMNNDFLDTFIKDNDTLHFGSYLSLTAIGGEHTIQHDENHVYATLQTHELLPKEILETSNLFVFYPLRNNLDIIGYVVTEGLTPIQRYNFHEFYFLVYCNAIESLRKKCLLNKLNEKLDDLYVRDSLTGFYNRFGLQRYGKPTYLRLLEEDKNVYFIFIDIDDMKLINDKYGHELGDATILETSGIIKIACSGKEAIIVRYGGDEFLIISAVPLKEELRIAEKEMIEQNKSPYDLSLAIGECSISKEESLTLEQAITKADQEMYVEKKLHKKIRNH